MLPGGCHPTQQQQHKRAARLQVGACHVGVWGGSMSAHQKTLLCMWKYCASGAGTLCHEQCVALRRSRAVLFVGAVGLVAGFGDAMIVCYCLYGFVHVRPAHR